MQHQHKGGMDTFVLMDTSLPCGLGEGQGQLISSSGLGKPKNLDRMDARWWEWQCLKEGGIRCLDRIRQVFERIVCHPIQTKCIPFLPEIVK